MGLFAMFRKTAKQTEEEAAIERARKEDLEIYSGMRVEVTSTDRRMFLVATLSGLRGDRAQLKPGTEGNLMTRSEDPIPVTLRGYSSKENKAVLMQGTVRLAASGVWQAEHLSLVKRSDDRVHVRADIDAEGSVSFPGDRGAPKEACRLLNISVGGICIGLETRRNVGEKFQLEARPFPDLEPFALHCQILRILERRHGYFEYGCRFVDLPAADEERILRGVFSLQNRG